MSCNTLRALKTKAEAGADPELGDVLVVGLHTKAVASFLKLVDANIHDCDRAVLSHLRRVVRLEHLPSNVYRGLSGHESLSCEHNQNLGVSAGEYPHSAAVNRVMAYVIVCSFSIVHEQSLKSVMAHLKSTERSGSEQVYSTVRVPMAPPKSQEQAIEWSQAYWPTVYKKHNPYGPQHNIIKEALAEIIDTASTYMELACAAGAQACAGGLGRSPGAVIVDRSRSKDGQIIAVAADARWYRRTRSERVGEGNCLAHAAMRAIAMVAQKRKALESGLEAAEEDQNFLERPITETEMAHDTRAQIEGGGYLCLDCEIYLTHEPCIMCCMALLHSRFGKVVIGRRMPLTGGLVTEDDRKPSYGLFWLPSLNWKLLAWQWSAIDQLDAPSEYATWHA